MSTIPEFGIKRENEERRDGGCAVIFDPLTKKYAVGKHTDNGMFRLFSGGVESGEDIKLGILREVVEESGLFDYSLVEKIGEAYSHYYNSLKNVNRVAHATCFLIIMKSRKVKPTNLEAHEKFVLEWATSEEIFKNWDINNKNKDCDHWIYFLNKSIEKIKSLDLDA